MNLPADPNNPPVDGPREGVDYTVRSKTQYDTAGRKAAEVDAMGRRGDLRPTTLDDTLKTRKLIGFPQPRRHRRATYVLEDNTYDNAGNRIKSVTDNGKTTTTYTIDAVGTRRDRDRRPGRAEAEDDVRPTTWPATSPGRRRPATGRTRTSPGRLR